MFNEANKTLNSYLKHLNSSGQIAGTVYKKPLTAWRVNPNSVREGTAWRRDNTRPKSPPSDIMVYYILVLWEKRKGKPISDEKFHASLDEEP